MQLRNVLAAARRTIRTHRPLQIAVVIGFWLAGNAIAERTHVPIPGGIIGMALLLALLASGGVRETTVRGGANWFVAEMLLFFVPAVLAILNHPELIGMLGLKVLTLILVSTILVMTVTALTVEFGMRLHAQPTEDHHAAAEPRS